MFKIFKENPYYLIGYLTFITRNNMEETKALQQKTFAFMFLSFISAAGSLSMAAYAVNLHNYPYAVGILVIVVVAGLWAIKRSKLA